MSGDVSVLPDFVEYISGEKEIFATRIYSVFSPDLQCPIGNGGI
ncbi:hypothetical protein [Paenibacillus jamilae]|nr:hypothetical protein [Paenibacillus jamilae]